MQVYIAHRDSRKKNLQMTAKHVCGVDACRESPATTYNCATNGNKYVTHLQSSDTALVYFSRRLVNADCIIMLYTIVSTVAACWVSVFICTLAAVTLECRNVFQSPIYMIQPVVKPDSQPVKCLYTRYNRLSNRFDNRLYRVNKHPTGLTTGWLFL